MKPWLSNVARAASLRRKSRKRAASGIAPLVRATGESGVIQERAGGKALLDDRKDGDAGSKKKPSFGDSAKKAGKPGFEKKKP